MSKNNLLTVEKAIELSGVDGELAIIDKEMREQCDLGYRHYFLQIGFASIQFSTEAQTSLVERGFNVERTENPVGVKVTW